MNYWQETVEIAFEEAKIIASQEQIDAVAGAVESSHENYGMAHGYDDIPNPLQMENERLAKELRIEKEKVVCKECHGTGNIIENAWNGINRSTSSRCWKCNGEGRYTLR